MRLLLASSGSGGGMNCTFRRDPRQGAMQTNPPEDLAARCALRSDFAGPDRDAPGPGSGAREDGSRRARADCAVSNARLEEDKPRATVPSRWRCSTATVVPANRAGRRPGRPARASELPLHEQRTGGTALQSATTLPVAATRFRGASKRSLSLTRTCARLRTLAGSSLRLRPYVNEAGSLATVHELILLELIREDAIVCGCSGRAFRLQRGVESPRPWIGMRQQRISKT